jgi:hypothetical protein
MARVQRTSATSATEWQRPEKADNDRFSLSAGRPPAAALSRSQPRHQFKDLGTIEYYFAEFERSLDAALRPRMA